MLNMQRCWRQPDTQRENLFICETNWLCFAFQFLTLCCQKSACFGNWTKCGNRKVGTFKTALWWRGSLGGRWAAPCQHGCFLVAYLCTKSLHCTRHLLLYFPMLCHLTQDAPPWKNVRKIPLKSTRKTSNRNVVSKGWGGVFIHITKNLSSYPQHQWKSQVRWHLPETPMLGRQRQEDPWVASLAEAMRFSETLSQEIEESTWLLPQMCTLSREHPQVLSTCKSMHSIRFTPELFWGCNSRAQPLLPSILRILLKQINNKYAYIYSFKLWV